MHTSLISTRVFTFLAGNFVKSQESKIKAAASKLPDIRMDANCHVEPIVIKGTRKSNDCDESFDCLQKSMPSDLFDDKYETEAEKLEHQVRYMLQITSAPAEQLELIDDLQRLGVAYHFDTEIKIILNRIYYQNYNNGDHYWAEADLHTAAIMFRLLRQRGYFVSQDIFSSFIDNDSGVFKLSLLKDIKGMLSLYEASYLSIEGETIMEEGLNFTTTHLHDLKISEQLVADAYLYALVTHALELPLHWRNQRSEVRWFIDTYSRKHDMNSSLLQLAKLDFNTVQKKYQDELQGLSRWWDNLGFVKAMDFVRDSLVLSYLWSAIIYWEPEYESTRRVVTQTVAFLTTLDDIYDVNGALEELELLTSVIERWDDVEDMQRLPHHMKMYYLAVQNFINELACLSREKNGFNPLTTLTNVWTTQVRSFLNESRWFHSGYQPTLEEYMSNARISVGLNVAAIHGYISDPKPVTETEIKYLETDPDILKWVSVIVRACNDLGTCQEELKSGNDTPKSVQCYIYENEASQEAAEKHVRDLVTKALKKMNEIRYTEKRIPSTKIDKLVDTARASMSIYQYMNRNGLEDSVTKDLISKILHEPILL